MSSEISNAAELIKAGKTITDLFTELISRSAGVSSDAAAKLVHEWLKHCDEKKLNATLVEMLDTTGSAKDLDNVHLTLTKVAPEAASTFSAVYQREFKRPALALDLSTQDSVIDGIGDIGISTMNGDEVDFSRIKNPAFVALSSEKEQLELIRSETHARMGLSSEIPMAYAKKFADRMIDNPMLEYNGLTQVQYEALRKEVENLPKEMRFTLFPEYERDENGAITAVNVGFLSKTGGLSEDNPHYSIPDIMKNLLVKTNVLENDSKYEPYFNKLEQDITTREDIVKTTILDVNSQKQDILNHLKTMDIDNPKLRTAFVQYVDKNYEIVAPGEMSSKFRDAFKKMNLDPITVNPLLKKLEEADRTVYVVKANVFLDKDTKKKMLKIDTQNYAEVGRTLNIYEHGKDVRQYGIGDEDIKDEKFAKAHKASELDGFMKSNATSPESTYVILTKDEFKRVKEHQRAIEVNDIESMEGKDGPDIIDRAVLRDLDKGEHIVTQSLNDHKIDLLIHDGPLDPADGRLGYNNIDRTELFGELDYDDDKMKTDYLEAAAEADATRFSTVERENFVEKEIEKAKEQIELEKGTKAKDKEEPVL